MLARLGLRPFAFACWDDQVGADVLEGLTVRPAAQHGVQHVVGDDRWASAVVSLAGGRVEAFEGGFADVRASPRRAGLSFLGGNDERRRSVTVLNLGPARCARRLPVAEIDW
jgi:hypothetical protein